MFIANAIQFSNRIFLCICVKHLFISASIIYYYYYILGLNTKRKSVSNFEKFETVNENLILILL